MKFLFCSDVFSSGWFAKQNRMSCPELTDEKNIFTINFYILILFKRKNQHDEATFNNARNGLSVFMDRIRPFTIINR